MLRTHLSVTLLALCLTFTACKGGKDKPEPGAKPGDAAAPKASDAAAATPTPGGESLTLGVIPIKKKDTNTSAELVGGFAKLLSEAIPGHTVDVKIVDSYEALIAALESGTVDFALMDGGAGWLSHKKAGARAILAEVSKTGEDPFYRAVAFVNAKLAAGPWDHDGKPDTEPRAQICHLSQTRGRISAHTSLTGSAGMIMPLGFMIQEKLVDVAKAQNQSDTSEIDGLLAQWFGGYVLGKGGAGGTHDVTAKLPANFRDLYGNHYANAFYHAYLGNADVAFVSESTPTQKFPEKDHAWTTSEMVTIQIRGDFPKTPEGQPDCAQITSPDYRKAHPDRFTFGKVPAHPVMAGKHITPEVEKAFVTGMTAVNDAKTHAPLHEAWKALYGKQGVAPIETLDHLSDIGQRIELIPGIQTKVKTKKEL